jgi:hypothetical protein
MRECRMAMLKGAAQEVRIAPCFQEHSIECSFEGAFHQAFSVLRDVPPLVLALSVAPLSLMSCVWNGKILCYLLIECKYVAKFFCRMTEETRQAGFLGWVLRFATRGARRTDPAFGRNIAVTLRSWFSRHRTVNHISKVLTVRSA